MLENGQTKELELKKTEIGLTWSHFPILSTPKDYPLVN